MQKYVSNAERSVEKWWLASMYGVTANIEPFWFYRTLTPHSHRRANRINPMFWYNIIASVVVRHQSYNGKHCLCLHSSTMKIWQFSTCSWVDQHTMMYKLAHFAQVNVWCAYKTNWWLIPIGLNSPHRWYETSRIDHRVISSNSNMVSAKMGSGIGFLRWMSSMILPYICSLVSTSRNLAYMTS